MSFSLCHSLSVKFVERDPYCLSCLCHVMAKEKGELTLFT